MRALAKRDVRKHVPEGWRIARLGDVAGVRGVVLDYQDEDALPYIALEHVANGGKLVGLGSATDFISAKTPFRSGDTLYGKLRPNLRKTLRATFDGVCSTEILAIYPQNGVEGRFLSELLRSDELHWHAMQGITGTKMPRTSWGHIQSYSFAFPPLPEQRAIAEVLDSIDSAIERTDDVIASTERLRDSLLHELLTRGVPGWHTSWNYEPGIGTVPASWEVVRLGEVCEPPEYGAGAPAIDYDPNLPRYVRITDLTDDGRLKFNDARSAEPTLVLGYELQPGDLLFARSGSVGRTYLYRTQDGPCVFAGYLIRFRTKPQVLLPEFLERWTRTQSYVQWIAATARRGAQTNINASEYASMKIPVPPLAEQQSIASMLDTVDVAVERAREERASLQGLKASASDELLTGRVRVGV